MSAIVVENVSKRYVIGHQTQADTLRDALGGGLRTVWNRLRRQRQTREEFYALRDVSFEVRPGEVVGIIGRNGAGKSTLLKILSRITEPTTGRITLNGRVASLLEVGTGFHPELSGRENIFLNGAILGMSRAEIRRKFDEIVAFSEVEKFLDTPVKRYSSGMYVRLAFAVAAHLEPEILIVDEVLAVGDAQFQKKCLGKMQDVSRREGRTVLVVSHNIAVIGAISQHCLLLEKGRLHYAGPPQEAINRYLAQDNALAGEWRAPRSTPKYETDSLRLLAARIVTDGGVSPEVALHQDLRVEIDFELKRPHPNVNTSIHILDDRGAVVFCAGPEKGESLPAGPRRHTCHIPARLLNDIRYHVSVFLILDATRIQIQAPEILAFTVTDTGRDRGEYQGHVMGVVRPDLRWSASTP